jgi:hypothetical protein
MCAKAVSRERTPYRNLAPKHHRRGRGSMFSTFGNGGSRGGESGTDGDGGGRRVTLGVGRWRAVPFVGQLPGVEQREDN